MTFLQPAFLWGLLGVAIPILIHLWHQKRGQPLPWAAMRWLREASEQQKRGLVFDDWLLLALRCLLIALLSVLLAQPVWQRNSANAIRTVHLVQRDSLISTNFRFELEQARQRNEPVVWLPSSKPLNPLLLQAQIDSLQRPGVALHLYLRNEASLADAPFISVPERLSLHVATAPNSPKNPADTRSDKPFNGLKSPLNVQVAYQNPAERQTVLAALRALAQVYDLNLNTNPEPSTQPDWLLTDKPASNPNPDVLYTVSGPNRPAMAAPNVVWVADTLTPKTADWVANGQLPEWLGEQLLQFYKLAPAPNALTQQELAGLFVRTNRRGANPMGRTAEQHGLLLFLLLVIGAERWLALRK